MNNNNNTIPSLNNSSSIADLKHNLRVQQLLKEREKIRQRSEELNRIYGHGLTEAGLAADSATLSLLNSSSVANCLVSTTGIDPFLGNSDCHSRQESSDSGLGLGSFSLPRIPDGLLNSDSEDGRGLRVSSASTPTTLASSSSLVGSPSVLSTHTHPSSMMSDDLGLDSLNITSMDLGGENMDSDDLMSNLPAGLAEDIQLADIEAFLSSSNNKSEQWL